jgi:hypothetical protein
MTVDQLKAALHKLPSGSGGLTVVFTLPNSLEEIIRQRGQLSVDKVATAPAGFGLLVSLTSDE